jgi:hypothetical protein
MTNKYVTPFNGEVYLENQVSQDIHCIIFSTCFFKKESSLFVITFVSADIYFTVNIYEGLSYTLLKHSVFYLKLVYLHSKVTQLYIYTENVLPQLHYLYSPPTFELRDGKYFCLHGK